MMAQLKLYLDPLSPHQLKKKKIKFGPPLTKLSGSTHVPEDPDQHAENPTDLDLPCFQ